MVETLAQLFLNTVKSYRKDDLMLYKKEGQYTPISTEEFEKKVISLALGLNQLGLKKGDKLAILSENSPDWVMTDFAAICQGALTVPIYTSLTAQQVEYILQDSDTSIVVVSCQDQREKIEAIRSSLKGVKHFITFEPASHPGFINLESLLETGRQRAAERPGLFTELVAAIQPEDEASLIYTSGTTGEPKGVILTHRNFISNIKTCVSLFDISYRDTVLSFLPLSHVLERMVMFAYIYAGATVGFAESVETVAQNLLEVKPNIMVSVPRVFEKIYASVMDTILAGSALTRKIFFWAYKVGKSYAQKELNQQKIPSLLKLKRKIAHQLVFSKIIEKTGGQVRFFISGGAPLAKDIAEFFYALGLVIYEGYGLTETAPVLAVNRPGALRFGTVGKPIPEVEIRINSDGEILARGPNVMKGYYKKQAETHEAFEGGWFHTGDIGYLDQDGFLVITDRKKDLIVTSGGKNVAPQPIENLLMSCPYIDTAVVIGDQRRFVTALVVPNFEKLEELARDRGLPFTDRKTLVRNEEIVKFIQAEIDQATAGLASYERIKKVGLLDRELEIEKGEITPTLKVRRAEVENRYRELIDSLYREEPSVSSPDSSDKSI
ncbi:MAG: long-chain fatty acid--CoA ligase [Acidobacteriota bacterium]|nr:long-chain fatty acid--CoA ligase [Acidobacteriota bacterium]MDW3228833.1 long-chain fatty acid--CoA ligase [Acidobacteriota bacterium]MDY0231556.1 long-chain fatty acid--CoA ligase [Candidatus Saccharicenans sp.]